MRLVSKLSKIVNLVFLNPRRFVSKLKHEFSAPSNSLISAARKIYSMFVSNKSVLLDDNEDRLLFVYDTLLNPVTFDFLHYLYYAESLRQQSGKAHIDILLVSRPNLTASREENYIAAIGSDNIDWRLSNLVVPLTRLFRFVERVYIVDKDAAFEIVKGYRNIYPEGYGYATPKTAIVRLDAPEFKYFPALTISETARDIIEAYFPVADSRKIVTITLRTYDYISARNSDIASWVDFAGELDPLKYRVVFLPDASIHGVAKLKKINQFEIFDSACWNIELRAALYQRAWMNMGVVSGPLAISGLMDNVWTVMIDRTMDYPENYRAHIISNGNIPGKAPIFYSKLCRFHLGVDNKETILKLFNDCLE